MNKRMLALSVGVSISTFGLAAPAVGLHETNEPVVPAHQHWINGQLVGPDACSDGMSLAFDHFHLNVHRGKPGMDLTRGDGTEGLDLVTGVFPCPAEPE